MPPDRLSRRQLNRATLARQLLLSRAAVAIPEAIERLGGLQAQEAKPPYIGLWTRLEGFRREDLHRALRERAAVRGTLMRATLHTVSGPDYVALRPALQPALDQALKGLRGRAEGLDLEQLARVARGLLGERPRTFNELRPLLAERFPEADERALGYAVRTQLPLVMVPTEDAWSFPRDAAFALAESWLGQPVRTDGGLEQLVLRYLAAFGPAAAADVQTWSGLKGMKTVLEGVRPRLRTFADERGRVLFDLPEVPRPEDEVPAPPRFLPEFDSLLLAHADRTRVVADEHRPSLVTKNLRVRAVFLVDGFAAGTWTVKRTKRRATLEITPFAPLAKDAGDELLAEAEALLRFTEDPDCAIEARTLDPAV